VRELVQALSCHSTRTPETSAAVMPQGLKRSVCMQVHLKPSSHHAPRVDRLLRSTVPLRPLPQCLLMRPAVALLKSLRRPRQQALGNRPSRASPTRVHKRARHSPKRRAQGRDVRGTDRKRRALGENSPCWVVHLCVHAPRVWDRAEQRARKLVRSKPIQARGQWAATPRAQAALSACGV
jgi:hypothetical protein